MAHSHRLPIATLCLLLAASAARGQVHEYDIVVYGGTSGGVTAAVQAARMGKSVALIDPGVYVGKNTDGTSRYVSHLGGLSSSGLGATDIGDGSSVGGVSYEFYRRLEQNGDIYRNWRFTPGNAEAVYEDMIAQAGVEVFRLEQLDRTGGVAKTGNRIDAITMKSGRTFRARQFIDAGYEGDLMAAADVGFTVGREDRATYGESFNGLAYDWTSEHVFGNKKVDPYLVPGDPSSGLIDGVHETSRVGANGDGDHRVQAYNYRMVWTRSSDRVRWTDLWGSSGQNPPDNYERDRYEIHDRFIQAGANLGDVVRLDTPIGGNKNDINNWGPASTDYVGANYDYPTADDATREQIIQDHIDYTLGLLYFLRFDATDASVRSAMSKWGLASDEFQDTGNFPHQIYVREARRMLGEYVMTELNTRDDSPVDVPAGTEIGMGSYAMDSHATHRYIRSDGTVEVEGIFWLNSKTRTYSIAYGAITPQQSEASNLLVSSAVSASHTAYGSMRMEPVFMLLGQSAATAAVEAIDSGKDVQDIDLARLQELMKAYGQVLRLDQTDPTGPWTGTALDNFLYGPTHERLNYVSYIYPGWDGTWTGDSGGQVYRAGRNLTRTGGLYLNSPTIAGLDGAIGGAGASKVQRKLRAGMDQTVWVSALVQLDALGDNQQSLLWLDSLGGDGSEGWVGLAEDGTLQAQLGTSAVISGPGIGADQLDQAHLLLLRIEMNALGDEDHFDAWLNPDLAELGPADLELDGRDLFGDLLEGLGASFGSGGGWLDAIRVSNEADGLWDVTILESGLGMTPGDATRDGLVDHDDFDVLVDNYRTARPPSWTMGDFNGDGAVTFADYVILSNHYGDGQAPPPGMLPEPSALLLLLPGAAAVGRRRR